VQIKGDLQCCAFANFCNRGQAFLLTTLQLSDIS